MINIGDKVSFTKKFTQDEVNAYSKCSNDNNPIHYESEYVSNTIFKKPIVQGLMVAGLFGGLLGSTLPGKGTIHLGQDLKFLKPVYVNEEVKASIQVIHIRKDKPIITFSCIVEKNDKSIAIEGKAVVMFKNN